MYVDYLVTFKLMKFQPIENKKIKNTISTLGNIVSFFKQNFDIKIGAKIEKN